MKKSRKILLIVLAVVVVIIGGGMAVVTDGLKTAVNVPVGSIDLSVVADGEYQGSYQYKRWSTAVNVVVSGHKIQSITLVKDVHASEMTDCSDEMLRRVVEAQDTQVDVVSGATATSKAYLKAIEDALSQ